MRLYPPLSRPQATVTFECIHRFKPICYLQVLSPCGIATARIETRVMSHSLTIGAIATKNYEPIIFAIPVCPRVACKNPRTAERNLIKFDTEEFFQDL
jgi:hypothetical protein